MPKALSHISSLKHLIDLQLERAPDGGKAGAAAFACPISGQVRRLAPCVPAAGGTAAERDSVAGSWPACLCERICHVRARGGAPAVARRAERGEAAERQARGVRRASHLRRPDPACAHLPPRPQPLNGKYKFVVVRRTGHVLSERAIKEVGVGWLAGC